MFKLQTLEATLVLAFISLASFPLLYLARSLDDNRLASWQWIFTDSSRFWISFYLLLALIAAFLLSGTLTIEEHPTTTILLLAPAMILPLWQEPELLIDSARYFIQAKYLSVYGLANFSLQWGLEIPAWTDLPLIPAFYGLLFNIFGDSRLVIQACNSLLFIATARLTCRLGAIMWDKETGFYGGLLLLGMPFLLTQVPLMLVDIPAMFLLMLAWYLFIRAILKGGGWMLFAPPALVLAIFAKYSIWPMLFLLPLTAIILRQGMARRQIITRGLVILIVGLLLTGGIAALKWPVFKTQMELLFTFQRPALGRWQEGLVSTFFFQIHPFISLLACLGIYRAIKTRDRHFILAAFFLLMVFGLQIRRIRYLIPLLPLLALMAAFGLQSLRDKQLKRFVGLSIVASTLVMLVTAYLPFFKTTSMQNIAEAGDFLNSLPGQAVEVIALPQHKSGGNTAPAIAQLDLFTTKKIINPQIWQDSNPSRQMRLEPLLFTWRLPRPAYYDGPLPNDAGLPLVVISDNTDLPPELAQRLAGRRPHKFHRQSGIFLYRTLVTVYE